jgi:dolichol kinase
MQFFLHEIVARIVAIYLCYDCGRKLWFGIRQRKIAVFNPDLLNWSRGIAQRDTGPIWYWSQMFIQTTLLFSCLFVSIFGWRLPNT